MTPLAVANPSSKHVLLLIDSKLRDAGSPFFVHPIVNSASILINPAGLDAFLKYVHRTEGRGTRRQGLGWSSRVEVVGYSLGFRL